MSKGDSKILTRIRGKFEMNSDHTAQVKNGKQLICKMSKKRLVKKRPSDAQMVLRVRSYTAFKIKEFLKWAVNPDRTLADFSALPVSQYQIDQGWRGWNTYMMEEFQWLISVRNADGLWHTCWEFLDDDSIFYLDGGRFQEYSLDWATVMTWAVGKFYDFNAEGYKAMRADIEAAKHSPNFLK